MAISRLCSIPDCGKPAKSKGWCGQHYQRWWSHGDPHAGRTPPGTLLAFMLDVVLAYRGSDCLMWPYSRSTNGYGVLTVDGRKQIAPRYVCEVINGPAPSQEHHAAHLCGKGHLGCVAPNHLVWKTIKENHADKELHGTVNRGSKNGRAHITEAQVIRARSLKEVMTTSQIATLFGVPRGTMWNILHGKSWQHI